MRLLILVGFGILALHGAESDCHTPLGIPCSTIQYEMGQWEARSLPRISHFSSEWTVAVRSDGSWASSADMATTSLFGIAREQHLITEMYLAPTDQVLRIDHGHRTISHHPRIIWHDRPYRRAKDGDAICATGILHSGTDFHLTGDTVIAGIPAKKWERGDGISWHEECDLAPGLDCTVLRHVDVRRNWLLLPTMITRMEATSVRLGTPNPKLFTIPTDYQEVKDPREDALRAFVARNHRSRQ
jgi:hypothetical protein